MQSSKTALCRSGLCSLESGCTALLSHSWPYIFTVDAKTDTTPFVLQKHRDPFSSTPPPPRGRISSFQSLQGWANQQAIRPIQEALSYHMNIRKALLNCITIFKHHAVAHPCLGFYISLQLSDLPYSSVQHLGVSEDCECCMSLNLTKGMRTGRCLKSSSLSMWICPFY